VGRGIADQKDDLEGLLVGAPLDLVDRVEEGLVDALGEVAAALPTAEAADRAGFYANAGRGASYDLLENIKKKTVKLEDLKKEQLPPELRNLTLPQQKAYLEKLDKERTELAGKARDLDKKRTTYIAQKQAEDLKNRARDSFDNQVLRVLQTQATRINVQYATPNAKQK